VEAANEQLKQADVSLDVQNEMIKKEYAVRNSVSSTFKQQKSVLEEANLNLGYTKIYATTDGYISKKSVEKGNQIQAGQPLMAIVPLNGIWITANYKETQITKIRPGQKVQIKIDAYPDKVFTGKVDSIMSGTGNVFSLFPPENATGNYIKVVQRISIKIVFDETTDTQNILRVGMSVVPTILVGKK
jgi:membrane fusion protein (multidrug efflux system)